MKLTLQLQLLPDAAQKADLLATMERFNEAASFAAAQGFAARVFGQVSIHQLCYRAIRQRFGLSAQMAVRAIAKAVECFQRDKTLCPVFKRARHHLRRAGAELQGSDRGQPVGTRRPSPHGVHGWGVPARLAGKHERTSRSRLPRQEVLPALHHRASGRRAHCSRGCDRHRPRYRQPRHGLHGRDVQQGRRSRKSAGAIPNAARGSTAREPGRPGADWPRFARGRLTSAATKTTASPRSSLPRPRQPPASWCLKTSNTYANGSRFGAGSGPSTAGGPSSSCRRSRSTRPSSPGVPVVYIDPRKTSRTCSACGHCEKANRKKPG